MILNMNQLRTFYFAAKTKSVTKAAQELMVTPPAVSMQIKQLEETLGIRLVFREGNAINLTEIGISVFSKADIIFANIRSLENFIEDISTAKSGDLRIGCTQTPAKYIMPRLIATFKDTYPGVKILIDQGTNSEMVRNILDRQNELALMRYRPDEKRLKIKVIGGEDVMLMAAIGSQHLPVDEISVLQLATVPLIVPKAGSGIRDVILEYLHRFKVEPNIAMESGSVGLIKELVRQDKAVSFFEKYAVGDDLQNESLRSVRILEGWPTIEFGIGYLQRKYLSPSAWAFLRLVEKQKKILAPPK